MKKLICAGILCLSLTLAACAQPGTGTDGVSGNASDNVVDILPDGQVASGTDAGSTPTNAQQPLYYGGWRVASCAGTSPVSGFQPNRLTGLSAQSSRTKRTAAPGRTSPKIAPSTRRAL